MKELKIQCKGSVKMVLTKNDYSILNILLDNACTTALKSYTVYEIHNFTKLSLVKIRQSVSHFVKIGLMNEGLYSRKAKTYYITQDGINKLNELKNN